jgi:hypothetical protein
VIRFRRLDDAIGTRLGNDFKAPRGDPRHGVGDRCGAGFRQRRTRWSWWWSRRAWRVTRQRIPRWTRGCRGRFPLLLLSLRLDWFWGYGWSYPGYAYRAQGGLDPGVARAEGLGGFDLDIKPRSAEVWVDGKFVGLVRDFDGYPSFRWLAQGTHTVAISKLGFATWEQEVSIDAGRVTSLKLALAPGTRGSPQSSD